MVSNPLKWNNTSIPTDIGNRYRKSENLQIKYSYIKEHKYMLMRVLVTMLKRNVFAYSNVLLSSLLCVSFSESKVFIFCSGMIPRYSMLKKKKFCRTVS